MSKSSPRYTVFCDSCYSWRHQGDGKRAAEQAATSHMSVYRHEVHLLDNKEGKAKAGS